MPVPLEMGASSGNAQPTHRIWQRDVRKMLIVPVVCAKLPYAQEHVLQDMHVMITLAHISCQYQPRTSFRNARGNAKLVIAT